MLALLLGTLALLCASETVQGDTWWQFLRSQREGALTWERFVGLVEHQYRFANPRWGQLVLILANEYRFVQIIVTPLAIVGTLLGSFALIRGRWPRPSEPEDSWLLVIVVAIAMTTLPQVGAIWFQPPICSNYIYPLAVQLAWLAPYRFLASRPQQVGPLGTASMLVLGALAGAGNEHTGVALALAAIGACYLGWRRDRRVAAWSIAGFVGLVAGYLFLLTAPGQSVRYGGLAEQSLFDHIIARGVLGNLELPGIFLAWLAPALILFAAVGVSALRRCTRAALHEALAFGALALITLLTALASPKQVARLLVAPSAFVAVAIGVILVDVSQVPAIARRLRIASISIITLWLVSLFAINVTTRIEGDERIRILTSAPPGSVARVPAFTFTRPTPFSLGDDFRSASVRKRVAVELGLQAIEWR